MHFELSPLIVWMVLCIVNTCSEFQVNICSNNRHIKKCQSFCTTMAATPTTTPDNDDAKAIAIPRVLSENSRATNAVNRHFLLSHNVSYPEKKKKFNVLSKI